MSTRQTFVLCAAVALIASVISCTSPVDVSTPRLRITTTTPHVPLPESLRVKPVSVKDTVIETDVKNWTSLNYAFLVVGLDTTFNPPLHWINGLLAANIPLMSKSPTARMLFFKMDTIPAGSSRPLLSQELRALTDRQIATRLQTDTLPADSMSAYYVSHFDAAQHTITDSVRFAIRNGRWGDSVVYMLAVVGVKY